MRRRKICIVTSAQFTVEVFLLDQLARLGERHDVTLLVRTDEPDFLRRRAINVKVVDAPVERRINLLRDLQTLWFLFRAFRSGSFDLVHSTTPKAGLLAMLAARLAGVPVRIHTFTGQVWGTRRGAMHWLLKTMDRITVWAATHILVDSNTQRDVLIRERVVSSGKSRVLANGSISGVDVGRFRPDAGMRANLRMRLGIPTEALVFLFMARLTRDKGALMIAEGFARFSRNGGMAHLIVVGPDEELLRPEMRRILGAVLDRVHFEDYTRVAEEFMAAADVFCLPSYREGFGTALINAAAAGIPAIASRIYGSEEAVRENQTGLLHEAGDAEELALKMRLLAAEPELRKQLGATARTRACRDFPEELVTSAVLAFYDELMSPGAVP